MPKKLLALLLIVIALFPVIDLTRAASTHFTKTFAAQDVETAVASPEVSGSAPAHFKATTPERYGVVRATWQATETR